MKPAPCPERRDSTIGPVCLCKPFTDYLRQRNAREHRARTLRNTCPHCQGSIWPGTMTHRNRKRT